MSELSISQGYFLCTLKENGKLPLFNFKIPISFLAAGLLDLLLEKFIEIGEDNKLQVLKELTPEFQHLDSIYTLIKDSQPIDFHSFLSKYALSLTNRRINILVNDIGQSLDEIGYVAKQQIEMYGKNPDYIPNKEYIDSVIQKIKKEMFEDETRSENIVALVSLMDKSNQIKRYLSKEEIKQLHIRIREIRSDKSKKYLEEIIVFIERLMATYISINPISI